MNKTEIMLNKLSGGELQQLAFELLPRLNHEWEFLIHNGIVEGTHKTRKGTPDLWMETEEGKLVYVQVTADSKRGKMLEDITKSIEHLLLLEKIKGALCILFVNIEPNPDEVLQCRSLCEQNNCRIEIFHNSKISKALDQEYNHDLRKKYLQIESNAKRSHNMLLVDSRSIISTPKKEESTPEAQLFIAAVLFLSIVTMVFYLRNETFIFWAGSSIFLLMTFLAAYQIYILKKKAMLDSLEPRHKKALWIPVFGWIGAATALTVIKFPFYNSNQIDVIKEQIIHNGMQGIISRIIELSIKNPLDSFFLFNQALSLLFLSFLCMLLLSFDIFHMTHIYINKNQIERNMIRKVFEWINKRTAFSQYIIFLNIYLIIFSIFLGSGLMAILVSHFNNSSKSIIVFLAAQ
jgi:hypothetical protein